MERRARTSPTSSPPFATQTIPATVHEATCILNGLLMNEDRKSTRRQVASPTMSSPRARSWLHVRPAHPRPVLPSKRLYVFKRSGVPKHLRPLVGGKVNAGLIDRNWTDILRGGGDHSRRDHAAEARLCKLAAYPRTRGDTAKTKVNTETVRMKHPAGAEASPRTSGQ